VGTVSCSPSDKITKDVSSSFITILKDPKIFEIYVYISGGSNTGGGEIFRTRRDWSCGPTSLQYSVYQVFSGGKAAGVWR